MDIWPLNLSIYLMPLELYFLQNDYGHLDYGENKVQEAVEKWTEIKKKILKLNYI